MADFKEIKSRISFQDVLGHYNISLKASNQFTLTGHCPLPSHGSEKSKASFSVNTDKNLFNCFSDSCKKVRGRSGGDVIEFVKQMESCTYQEAGNKLSEWFLQKSEAKVYEPFGRTLKDITSVHPVYSVPSRCV